MTNLSHAEALLLIERAVLAIQATYGPGRTAYLALDRVHSALQHARAEVSSSTAAIYVLDARPA